MRDFRSRDGLDYFLRLVNSVSWKRMHAILLYRCDVCIYSGSRGKK